MGDGAYGHRHELNSQGSHCFGDPIHVLFSALLRRWNPVTSDPEAWALFAE